MVHKKAWEEEHTKGILQWDITTSVNTFSWLNKKLSKEHFPQESWAHFCFFSEDHCRKNCLGSPNILVKIFQHPWDTIYYQGPTIRTLAESQRVYFVLTSNSTTLLMSRENITSSPYLLWDSIHITGHFIWLNPTDLNSRETKKRLRWRELKKVNSKWLEKYIQLKFNLNSSY